MFIRLIGLFVGIIIFITGCNGLLSGVAGTQRLREITAEQAVREGLGDADFVELQMACPTGWDQVFPGNKGKDPSILVYEVRPCSATASAGPKRNTLFIWKKCERGRESCFPGTSLSIRGMWRKPPKTTLEALHAEYQPGGERPVFIEEGKAPLAWYWQAGIMAGAIGLLLLNEWIWGRGKRPRRKV